VISVLNSGAEGPKLKSQPQRCRVIVLGKLFTPIVPLFTKHAEVVAALLRVARELQAWRKVVAAYTAGFMTHVTCRLTARTGISSGTLRSAIEYGLPLPIPKEC